VQKPIAVVFVALATLLTVSAVARAQSADPWMGTWKVNLAKSTFSPGPKPTVAGTVKMELASGAMKSTLDGVNAQGQPTHTETVSKFDSTDVPVKGAAAPNSTSAFKRIDGRTFQVVGKVDGKMTVTTRVAISADGKTATATQSGKNAQGQSVNNTIVLDRQ
jgi:hypothetical protein